MTTNNTLREAKGTITIESHYSKQNGTVYYYWRVVGSGTWNVQKTALKEIPYHLSTNQEGEE